MQAAAAGANSETRGVSDQVGRVLFELLATRESLIFFVFFLSLDNNQFTSLHRPEQSIQLYPLILIIALLLHRLKIVILLKKFK